VLRRTRLFTLLERPRGAAGVWLWGPPGAGKTTLVASWLEHRRRRALWYQVDQGDADPATMFHYLALAVRGPRGARLPVLTPDHLAGLAQFGRRFFEALCARLPPATVLVFDNVQEVAVDGPVPELLASGFTALPHDVVAVFTSRSEPPPAFARLRAEARLRTIDPAVLRLSPREAASVARLRGRDAHRRPDVAAMHARTGGWVAGVVLLVEAGAEGRASGAPDAVAAPQSVFDYFAGEIFAQLEPAAQRLLVETAVLPGVTEPLARDLTGHPDPGHVLDDLARRHWFTERRPGTPPEYQYHPLFRSFLLGRAATTLSAADQERLWRDAGRALAAAGRVEDAFPLLVRAGETGEAVALLRAVAPALVAQGRIHSLEEWIAALPADVASGDPWLCYWRGTCRLPFDPAAARLQFRAAYEGLRDGGDRAGLLAAWSGAVESILFEMSDFARLDPWLDALPALVDGGFPTREIEARLKLAALAALGFRRPEEAAGVVGWALESTTLLPLLEDLRQRTFHGFHLVLPLLYGGLAGIAAPIIEHLREAASSSEAPDEARLTWRLAQAFYLWHVGRPAECLEAVAEGQRLADATGLHWWDFQLAASGCAAALIAGDAARAARFLVEMRSVLGTTNHFQIAQHRYLSAWHAFRCNDLDGARRNLDVADRELAIAGAPFPMALNRLGAAQVAHAQGQPAAAAAHLSAARAIGKRIGEVFTLYRTRLAEAQFALDRGDEPATERVLAQAFALDREFGFPRSYWWDDAAMGRLCATALARGIEVEHVRALVRRFALPAPAGALGLEAWPWPLRVTTLGRFAVEVHGAPLAVGGKAQRRPLQLLAAIIAHGGEAAEATLADALWPDADGDAAHQAFATTLHRLRQLLDVDGALCLHDGRLSIDRRLCWVDVWAFEQALADGAPLERLLALHPGPFLAGERDAEWAASLRERLRSRYLGALLRDAEGLERAGRLDSAIAAYHRGLQVDELTESFHRGLMRCHEARGDGGAAVAAYERCRRILQARLGVAPSPETEAVRRRLGAR
jgi:DNA-binding SARP family transcriptional activator